MVLPEHLWARTALGRAAAVRLSAPYAAASNARLDARPIDDWIDLPAQAGAPLPVASLVPEALSAWSRLVAGAGGAVSAGFVLDLTPIKEAPLPGGSGPSPQIRLSRFWRAASPTARRLAGLLAASPVISLPVIHLVRQALLPEARQVHEAEVLLGELLRLVKSPAEASRDPDELRYEFYDGVRFLLLDSVPTADALTVLEQVSSYVEEHLESGLDFRAVLADPAVARGSIVADESPFARVAADVLLRLGGDYARLVAALPVEPAATATPGASGVGFPSPPGRVGGAPPLQDPPALSGARPPRSLSIHEKLSRVRKPRVHITYEVETDGARVSLELPFVMGVLGDFSGQPTEPLKPLKDRSFIQIDRDNFDNVLAGMTAGLKLRVPNNLKGDGSQLFVKLKFNSLEDLAPARVVHQVEPLKKLLDTRDRLRDLLTKVDRSDELENLLEQILKSDEDIKNLAGQLVVTEQRDREDLNQSSVSVRTEEFKSWPKPQAEQPSPGQQGADEAKTDRPPVNTGQEQTPSSAAGPQEASLLDQVLSATKHTDRQSARGLVKNLVDQSLAGVVTFDRNVTTTIVAAIKAIDDKLSAQLSAILHHPDFQKLEGTWRGLHYLVMTSETSSMLKINVLNVSKRELFSDVDKVVEFDQSQLFKKVYENEFGKRGGEPFGAIVGDYEFTNHPEDIDLLGKVSNVAAAAFCPFISAAGPKLFGFESWHELSRPRDLEKIFTSIEYAKWKAFRDSEDSRFVSLVMPRVLARLPYGASTTPIEEFGFEEVDNSKPVSHTEFTWMNAAYVFGTRMNEAFARFGFCTAIRGAEGGGKVEGLPAFLFTTDDGDMDLKCPTELGITDRREAELSNLGFLPLCHYKNTDYAVFFSGQTVQRPVKYDRQEATVNAAIAARLPCIMATSRFVHYIKVMARDGIGSFKEPGDVEDSLDRWIKNYVNANPTAAQENRAKYPLREAKVTVQEVPGQPGSFQVIAWMRPWLQFEELTASMRLVASIPKSTGSSSDRISGRPSPPASGGQSANPSHPQRGIGEWKK